MKKMIVSKYQKACKGLIARKISVLICAKYAAGVIAILLTYYSKQKPEATDSPIYEEFLRFCGAYSVHVSIGALTFIFIVEIVYVFLEKRTGFDEKLANLLLVSFDRIVGSKASRFSGYRKKNNNNNERDTFIAITKPEEQITQIVEGIYWVLRDYYKADDLDVVLARCDDDGIMSKNFYHCPESDAPSISSEEIDVNKSTFLRYVFDEKKNCYISDLKAEKRDQENFANKKKRKANSRARRKSKFLFVSGEEEGAISGYFISQRENSKKAIFILTIMSNKISMNKDFIIKTKKMVEMYQRRLQLEYELLLLKENVNLGVKHEK